MLGLFLAVTMGTASPAAAQPADGIAPVRLSIEDALGRAAPSSESLTAARASVDGAREQVAAARSGRLPQVNASAAYQRTLKTEFEGLSFPSDMSMPGAAVDLPFGQSNTWRAGLTIVQPIYDGGRTSSSIAQARAGVVAAQLDVRSVQAQVVLAVAQAYYDAALALRQVAIAEASLAQAERTLADAQLSQRNGAVPEFDVLRAEVARDNQRTALVQFRASRDVGLVQLKRLVGLPLGAPVELTSALEVEDVDRLAPTARAAAGLEAGAPRTAVAQAEQVVRARTASLGVARADRWPQLNASSDLGFVDYPDGFLFDTDWRTNWTVGVAVSFPVFDGFRRRAAVRAARADVRVAQARLAEATEVTQVEAVQIDAAIATAEATWQTSERTMTQAERAFEIAEVRYQQGASTQLELNDTRLQLQQAQLNQARAARDLRLARVRRELLPGLPLGAAAGLAPSSVTGSAPTGF